MLRAARVFAVVFLVFPAPAFAADAAGAPDALPPVDAAAIAREVRTRHELPGFMCAVVTKDGGIHAIGADGRRAVEKDAAITTHDRMHLGSCTKAFTATLAAVHVAEGALRWDSSIGETVGLTLPDIDPAWRPVTLEQLRRHRAGAPANADPKAWAAAWTCAESPGACRAAFVEATLAKAPVGIGTFAYSNQGYAIAGRMIEVVAGESKDYETLLAERVLEPLGIKRFGFGVPTKAEASSPVGHRQPELDRTRGDAAHAARRVGQVHRVPSWGEGPGGARGRRARTAEAARALEGCSVRSARLEERDATVGRECAHACWLEHRVVLRGVAFAREGLRRPRSRQPRR